MVQELLARKFYLLRKAWSQFLQLNELNISPNNELVGDSMACRDNKDLAMIQQIVFLMSLE